MLKNSKFPKIEAIGKKKPAFLAGFFNNHFNKGVIFEGFEILFIALHPSSHQVLDSCLDITKETDTANRFSVDDSELFVD